MDLTVFFFLFQKQLSKYTEASHNRDLILIMLWHYRLTAVGFKSTVMINYKEGQSINTLTKAAKIQSKQKSSQDVARHFRDQC